MSEGLAPETYVMGRTPAEYERLRVQARLFEAITERALRLAGVEAGQSALDVGCGPGEVMRLLGELVGPTGHVTGLDVDGVLGHEALAWLEAEGASRYTFVEGDLGRIELPPGGPFDVVYARLLLIHVTDPIAALKTMFDWVKPGGVLVVQDVDFSSMGVYPTYATWARYEQILKEMFETIGSDHRFGLKLPSLFEEAGVGAPDGTDVGGIHTPLATLAGIYGPALSSVLPVAIERGVTTAEEAAVLLADLDEAAQDEQVRALSPLLVGAWKRKPV